MKILSRALVVALLAFGTSAASAQAWTPDDPSNRGVITVSAESLRTILKTMGATEVAAAKGLDDKILAEFPNGSRVILALQPCAKTSDCRKLVLASVIELPALEPEASKDLLLTYLGRFPFVNLSLSKDRSSALMMRSVVSDYGIPRGNLYMELVSFAHHVSQFGTATRKAASAGAR
jgi:hypothetical protein